MENILGDIQLLGIAGFAIFGSCAVESDSLVVPLIVAFVSLGVAAIGKIVEVIYETESDSDYSRHIGI